MIQKTLRTTTGKLNVQIPSDLQELTLGQMMQLQDCKDLDDLTAISILSGISVEELKNVKNVNELFTFGEAILTLSYQIKHLYNAEEIPKRITFFINDTVKTLNVISNLSVEPAGAFMAAREIIAEEIKESIKTHGEENWQQYFNPSLNACCQVLAHYFFCRVTGKPYNEYEAEDFVNEVKKLRVTEALPTAHANEIEKFLWDHKEDFPLWRFSGRNKSSRQAGPRIRSIDRTNYNYPGYGTEPADSMIPPYQFLN